MGSRAYLHSRDMASEIIIAFPAHTHLHTHEIRGHLLGMPRLDLGQFGLLRRPGFHSHL